MCVDAPMNEHLASVRVRSALLEQLHLLAANLSYQQHIRITMRSLLEEGLEDLFRQSLTEWVSWASQSVAQISQAEPSVSFRIQADLVRRLGVLAAEITARSNTPITKVQLLEEAGRRIMAQKQAGQEEGNLLSGSSMGKKPNSIWRGQKEASLQSG